MENQIEIIVENEYVGTRTFEDLFNEFNKELIEKNAQEYLASVA